MQPVSSDIESKDGLEYQKCETDEYTIRIAFVEDAFKYLIFHVDVESFSKDTILLEVDDWEWSVDRPDKIDWLNTIDKKEMISLLEREKDEIKKAKKTSTITNVILSGLEVLAIATSPGGGTSAVFYALESGSYIAEYRNAFNVASLSIEDEMKYINDWVLTSKKLTPYEAIGFDIIIDRSLSDYPILFRSLLNDQKCEFEFHPH